MAVLAIDVGTTGLKAAIYGERGTQQAIAWTEYQAGAEGGVKSELDPVQLWGAFRDLIRRVVATAGVEVRGVSIASHGESFLPMNKMGQPIGPFILNIDSRSHREANEIANEMGPEKLYELTGLPPHSMYCLPKIIWLRRHRPTIFAAARKFLCIEDFLLDRLGVGPYISHSLASRTLCFDLIRGGWSQELLHYAGIDANQLSEPVPSGKPLGKANPRIAAELNLPPEAIWVSGGHDQACGSLGGGGVSSGVAVDGTGTFECISFAVRQPTLSSQTRECNFPCERHVVPDRFLTLAYAPGGVVLKWIRDQLSTSHTEFARKKNQNPYEIMLADLPDNPTRLMFFPYLLGTGTPWLNDTVQGAIWGISATTRYETIVKAALEGITYEICWNLDLLERAGITCERMHAVGGGAQSSVWLQLKADVFGREVVAVQGESSCVGAAICASIGLGLHQSWEEAAKDMITFGRSYHPRPTIHNQYREMLERYKDLAARIYGFKSSQKGVQECEKQL